MCRRIRVVSVKLPKDGRLGSLELDGDWKSTLTEEPARRLKPYEGTDLEISEVIRLGELQTDSANQISMRE
jgi:hypothetical protein